MKWLTVEYFINNHLQARFLQLILISPFSPTFPTTHWTDANTERTRRLTSSIQLWPWSDLDHSVRSGQYFKSYLRRPTFQTYVWCSLLRIEWGSEFLLQTLHGRMNLCRKIKVAAELSYNLSLKKKQAFHDNFGQMGNFGLRIRVNTIDYSLMLHHLWTTAMVTESSKQWPLTNGLAQLTTFIWFKGFHV